MAKFDLDLYYTYATGILKLGCNETVSEEVSKELSDFEDSYEQRIFNPLLELVLGQFHDKKADIGVKGITTVCTASELSILTPSTSNTEPYQALFSALPYPCNCIMCGSQKNKIPYDKGDLFVFGKRHISAPEPIMDRQVGFWACRTHSYQLQVVYAAAHFFELFKREMEKLDYTSLDEALGPTFGKRDKAGGFAKPMAKWKASESAPEAVKVVCGFRDQLKYLMDILN